MFKLFLVRVVGSAGFLRFAALDVEQQHTHKHNNTQTETDVRNLFSNEVTMILFLLIGTLLVF